MTPRTPSLTAESATDCAVSNRAPTDPTPPAGRDTRPLLPRAAGFDLPERGESLADSALPAEAPEESPPGDAHAAPEPPTDTAAPIPNATAKAPTRPTYADPRIPNPPNQGKQHQHHLPTKQEAKMPHRRTPRERQTEITSAAAKAPQPRVIIAQKSEAPTRFSRKRRAFRSRQSYVRQHNSSPGQPESRSSRSATGRPLTPNGGPNSPTSVFDRQQPGSHSSPVATFIRFALGTSGNHHPRTVPARKFASVVVNCLTLASGRFGVQLKCRIFSSPTTLPAVEAYQPPERPDVW